MRLAAVVMVSLPLAILPCPASATRAVDPVALVRRGLAGWNVTTTSACSSSLLVQTRGTGSSAPSDSNTSSSTLPLPISTTVVADSDLPSDTLSAVPQDIAKQSEDSTHPAQIRTLPVPPEAPHAIPTSTPSSRQPQPRPPSSFQHVYLNTTTSLKQLAPSPTNNSSTESFLHPPGSAAPFVAPLSYHTELSSSSGRRPLVFLTLNLTSATTSLMNGTHGQPPVETDHCSLPANGSRPTTYSIVYTATTTFFGEPTDYKPSFPAIETPVACVTPTLAPGPESAEPPGFEEEAPGFGGNEPLLTTFCFTTLGKEACATDIVHPPGAISVPGNKEPGTVTFITTDKNPYVVFSPVSTPNYGKTKNPHAGEHHTVDGANPQRPHPHGPGGTKDLPHTDKRPAATTFRVTLEPTKVIIDDQTFSVLPTQTTRVTVSDETFVINPTQVIGGGSTIDRPWNGGEGNGFWAGTGGSTGSGGMEASGKGNGATGGQGAGGQGARGQGATIMPTTTTVGNVPVVIAPAGTQPVVIIGETTFSMPPRGTTVTAMVQGTAITIDPTAIHFPSETIPIRTAIAKPLETEHVVVGGRMITAIGSTVVVIHETTITYGPGIAARTEEVDGGTVTIGPSGVVIDEKTIGGPEAGPKQTAYEIVGGVTITQIGASVVVIDDSTWTIGPEAKSTHTTEIGGETIVIAPEGVTVESLSFTYPFGPTVVTSIKATPSVTHTGPLASQTQDGTNNRVSNGGSPNGDDDDEGSGMGLRGALSGAMFNLGFCIIFGVWHIVGFMF